MAAAAASRPIQYHAENVSRGDKVPAGVLESVIKDFGSPSSGYLSHDPAGVQEPWGPSEG